MLKRMLACTGLCLASFLAGCASQPHLNDVQRREMGKPEVVFVKAPDELVVTDPLGTRMSHLGKLVTLDWLFGGIGIIAYAADHRSPGDMDSNVERARGLFEAQQWPAHIESLLEGVAAQSPALAGAPHRTLDLAPNTAEMQKLAAAGQADSMIFLIPEMQIGNDGDRLRMVVHVVAVARPLACHACTFANVADRQVMIADQELDVTQSVVAVGGGKTWEEQKQSGHAVHALTEGDYTMFWFRNDPKPPLVGFMGAAYPELQAMLTTYFGREQPKPAPLPTLKMVVY